MNNHPGEVPIDQNRRSALAALSTSDGETILPAEINSADKGVLVHVTNTSGSLVAAPLVGQTAVASTGVAVNLNGGTSQPLSNGLIITAPIGNAEPICIGNSGVNNTFNGTGNGYILAQGSSISFAVTNTTDIWVNGTSGDYVSWAGS